jgi:small subunit ribosomal protein S3
LGRNDAPSLDSTPRPDDEERRQRRPRRGERDSRGGAGARRRTTLHPAGGDGSDKPAEAVSGVAEAAAPAAAQPQPKGE